MFIDGAAAAYKSKNGMVRFTRAISFYCMEKKLREKLA